MNGWDDIHTGANPTKAAMSGNYNYNGDKIKQSDARGHCPLVRHLAKIAGLSGATAPPATKVATRDEGKHPLKCKWQQKKIRKASQLNG